MKRLACVVLSGVLVIGAGALSVARAGEEQGETHVQFKELAPAVQKTFKSAAAGQEIKTVDVEHDKDVTFYEADVKLNGQNYEIRVATDGKLISKKVDNEDQHGEHEDQDHDRNEKD